MAYRVETFCPDYLATLHNRRRMGTFLTADASYPIWVHPEKISHLEFITESSTHRAYFTYAAMTNMVKSDDPVYVRGFGWLAVADFDFSRTKGMRLGAGILVN